MTEVSARPRDGFWTAENEHLLVRLNAERCWFEVTDKRIIMRQGLFSQSERSVRLENVQDVVVEQGLLGSLFGWGTLNVETSATPGTEFTFKLIARPGRVRDAIFAAQEAAED